VAKTPQAFVEIFIVGTVAKLFNAVVTECVQVRQSQYTLSAKPDNNLFRHGLGKIDEYIVGFDWDMDVRAFIVAEVALVTSFVAKLVFPFRNFV
jgi:hypothetical protein